MAQKNDDRLSVRVPSELRAVLAEIEEKHGFSEPLLARKCLEAVAGFYRENGYFSFPVHIIPDAEFVRAVTEGPAPGYVHGGSNKPAPKLRESAAASQTPPKKKSA